MKAEQRWWRTAGGGLVPDGHPEAAALAYGPGDEIAQGDQTKLRTPEPEQAEEKSAASKRRAPAANKQRRPAADK